MRNNKISEIAVPEKLTTSSQYDTLIRVALEKDADIDKLQKLMEMKMVYENNQARKSYHAAMASFKSEVPTLLKTATAQVRGQTKSGKVYNFEIKHADLGMVCEAIAPCLAKHGFSHKWHTVVKDNTINVSCIITHKDGYSDDPVTLPGQPDNTGAKNDIQAMGSTVSYLQRYTLISALGLAVKHEDDDGKTAIAKGFNTITEEQSNIIQNLIDETKADEVKFLEFAEADSVPEILTSRYGSLKGMLEAKR